MKSRKVFKGLNHLFEYVYDLAKLNLLFLLYTLRGLIIFGVFPAFVSLLNCIRLIFFNKKEDSFRELFKENYKRDFKQANIIGWLFTLVSMIFYGNYLAIQSSNNQIPFFIIFSFYTVLFLHLVVGLWVFPLMSYHYNSVKNHLINALALGITNIGKTLVLSLFLFFILYISLLLPAFLLFFTASVFSYMGIKLTLTPIVMIKIKVQ